MVDVPSICFNYSRLALHTVLLDFLQYGTRWQKRTRLDGDLPGIQSLQQL